MTLKKINFISLTELTDKQTDRPDKFNLIKKHYLLLEKNRQTTKLPNYLLWQEAMV
jgi:hypothetical protein